jgi:hypothetical protein
VEWLGEATSFECGRLAQLFPYGAAGGGNAVGVFDVDRVRR